MVHRVNGRPILLYHESIITLTAAACVAAADLMSVKRFLIFSSSLTISTTTVYSIAHTVGAFTH